MNVLIYEAKILESNLLAKYVNTCTEFGSPLQYNIQYTKTLQ